MKDKKLIVKILVPVVIVAVIVGIWFVKNTPEKEEITDNQSQVGQENEEIQGADFTLKVSEQIDFEALAEYGLPVIADYGLDDCIPCKQMALLLFRAMN